MRGARDLVKCFLHLLRRRVLGHLEEQMGRLSTARGYALGPQQDVGPRAAHISSPVGAPNTCPSAPSREIRGSVM